VIKKPYSTISVVRRVQRLVDLHMHKQRLEQLVAEQTEAIRNSNQVVLDTLSSIIEHRNTESGKHVLRIRRFTKVLLEDVAQCYPEYGLNSTNIDIISSAAALHDLGKIAIPDSILNKPGKLTEDEYEVIKTHTTVGAKLVAQLSSMGDATFLRYAHNIALYHHERYDGSGYPCGLVGEQIPICAQVVGIADAFDALTTARAYKKAIPCEEAAKMIVNGECGKFSPKLLECFKYVREEFYRLAEKYSDIDPAIDDEAPMPTPMPQPDSQSIQLQLVRSKYLSLLHYINDTVMELDLTELSFRVVYNPNPDLDILSDNISFSELIYNMAQGIKVEENELVSKLLHNYANEALWTRFRKRTFPCDLPSNFSGGMVHYDLTLLRVNTDSTDHKLLLAIFHKTKEYRGNAATAKRENIAANHILRTLTCCVLRTTMDSKLTIDKGVENLQALTGYSPDEVESKFASSLYEMILAEDREPFAAHIEQAVSQSCKMEGEYKLSRKNCTVLWVLCKTRKINESDGTEYLYHTLTDISYVKAQQEKLEQDNIRSQIIIDQTGGITFEWDLIRDVLICSDKYQERFGYPPISTDFSSKLYGVNHIHPDDVNLMRTSAKNLESGAPLVDIDVRLSNASGRYHWSKIRAATMYNDNGLPVRVVGIITDVDELKNVTINFKEQAERDSLTRLYNKTSTRQFIDAYLEQRQPHEMAAILLMDLDNFKNVNDNYGHLYGDAVLTQVGIDLRRMFHTDDIIGRVGGDEFLVLMKNLPNKETLEEHCRALQVEFRETFEELMPGMGVDFSIGCALVPEHGSTFNALFQHADTALYSAKVNGKASFVIFDPRTEYNKLIDFTSITRVDSDEEPTLGDDSFMRFVFHRLYQSNNISDTINEILAFIGGKFNVSRVYIFENSPDNTTCSNTFEWCNVGVQPEIDKLQNLSYATDIPGWENEYDENGIFYCTDITLMKAEYRNVLEPQGIKSILICSIMDGDHYCGYVGFDECTRNRFWTQTQISLLSFLAEVMGVFLIKLRSHEPTLPSTPPSPPEH
jgi:putative two-component system response regulator